MTRKLFKSSAGAMALTFAAFAPLSMQAQPMYDRIHVNLPYTVTLENKTLQPGDYTIQQLPSNTGSSRVLLFYTNDGLKFETSAMTIPALDINTAHDTKLVLNHVGNDYYISKIWVQGKDYGYELPVPNSMKSRQNERMTEATVAGTNQPSSSAEMTTSTAAASTAPATSADVNTAATSTAPITDAGTTAAMQATVQTAPPATVNSNNPADTANRPVADAASPTPLATAATTQPATPTASGDTSADRAMPTQSASDATSSASRTSMPSTAAGWLTMLLAGGGLSGAGLMLRRKR